MASKRTRTRNNKVDNIRLNYLVDNHQSVEVIKEELPRLSSRYILNIMLKRSRERRDSVGELNEI